MRSRRSVLVLGIVIALMLSVISVASADGPKKQKVNFDAFAPLQFVGPGELIGLDATSTELLEIKTRKNKKKTANSGAIKKIVVKTTNEGVIAAPTFVTGCGPHPDGPACEATASLLDNAANISQHTSTAKLTNVTTSSTPAIFLPGALTGFWSAIGIPAELASGLDAYSGKIKGKLDSTFTILGGSGDVLVGSARLNINRGGDATYSCFTDNPKFAGLPITPTNQPYIPLPSILFCSADNPLPPVVRTLFLPTLLDIVDTGRLQIVPPEGSDVVIDPTTLEPVVVNGLTLKKLTGRLNVRVIAENGELINPDEFNPVNRITIHPGKAVWLDLDGDGE